MKESEQLDNPITLKIWHEEIVIRRRYQTLSILNDFLIGLWFLIGSILFLNESTATTGTWLFIVGSFQLIIRPAIRLAAHIHLKKIPSSQWNS
jgi:hypothetical protein